MKLSVKVPSDSLRQNIYRSEAGERHSRRMCPSLKQLKHVTLEGFWRRWRRCWVFMLWYRYGQGRWVIGSLVISVIRPYLCKLVDEVKDPEYSARWNDSRMATKSDCMRLEMWKSDWWSVEIMDKTGRKVEDGLSCSGNTKWKRGLWG